MTQLESTHMEPSTDDTADGREQFLKVHMPAQRAVFSFLLAAVHDYQTAEDLLQEVTLILWKKFGDYRTSEPYLRWAFGIARNVVARHFQSQAAARVRLRILEFAAVSAEEHAPQLSSESQALLSCLEKLPPEQRELIKRRYEDGVALKSLADQFGQSLAKVNMTLVRLRRALLDCTKRTVLREGRAS